MLYIFKQVKDLTGEIFSQSSSSLSPLPDRYNHLRTFVYASVLSLLVDETHTERNPRSFFSKAQLLIVHALFVILEVTVSFLWSFWSLFVLILFFFCRTNTYNKVVW